MNIRIGVATHQDRDAIRDIYLQAFPEAESQLIAKLSANLLSQQSEPVSVSLVAEMDGEVAGHVAFSPAYADASKKCLDYIQAPLAVKPK